MVPEVSVTERCCQVDDTGWLPPWAGQCFTLTGIDPLDMFGKMQCCMQCFCQNYHPWTYPHVMVVHTTLLLFLKKFFYSYSIYLFIYLFLAVLGLRFV